MISIIICSKHSDISPVLKENIKNTIGINYEIIVIDNSINKHSIFSAYNMGFSQSKFPYLCFVHEDVFFCTENWGKRLINHLRDIKCGIVGVAGGKLIAKVPAQWSNEKRYINVIQHRKDKKTPTLIKEPADFQELRQSVILLDGVFLSMRRDLFTKIKFDEYLTGFHGYDYDISIQSIVAGYNNYIIYDILLEHYSEGYKDFRFYKNLIEIYKKWAERLPLFTKDISEEVLVKRKIIETRRLKRLVRRMAKTGFTTQDIVSNTMFFIDNLKKEGVKIEIKYVTLRIFFTRLFNSPRYLFK